MWHRAKRELQAKSRHSLDLLNGAALLRCALFNAPSPQSIWIRSTFCSVAPCIVAPSILIVEKRERIRLLSGLHPFARKHELLHRSQMRLGNSALVQ